MDDRIAASADPRDFGKPLRGNKFGLWRYRVRDYRILCEIRESRLIVLVVTVGHRSTVYDE
jgi:mRNA interferase RelE/StbE